jgi:hypothetical protein
MARHQEGCWYLMTICFQAGVPLGLSSDVEPGMFPFFFESVTGIINGSLAFSPGWIKTIHTT